VADRALAFTRTIAMKTDALESIKLTKTRAEWADRRTACREETAVSQVVG
jgi:hypothetical protein